MSHVIDSEAKLRNLIPAPIDKVRLKILPRLEAHSRRFLELASVIGLTAGSSSDATLAGVSVLLGRGRARVISDAVIEFDDDGWFASWRATKPSDASIWIGGLVVVPGLGETLRINGHVERGSAGASNSTGMIRIIVDEVYLQCPKALIRSELWQPTTWRTPAAASAVDATAFVAQSPFALLATANRDGHADLSPRGDPRGGLLRWLPDGKLLIPDRTGNQLVDSLRNLIANPAVALAVVVPGDRRLLHVAGTATLTDDPDLLAPSTLRGKPPKVGIIVDVRTAQFAPQPIAALWDANNLTDPSEIILDQVNPGGKTLNKIGSKIFDLGNAFHKKHRLY